MAASKAYVDNASLHREMLAFRETRVPSGALLAMVQAIHKGLCGNSKFRGYDSMDLEDLRSTAMLEFLKYGHNFKPEKCRSANGAFTFVTWCAESAFKRYLRGHYRQVNVKAAHDACGEVLTEWCENYTTRMLDDGRSLDAPQETFLAALD